MSTAALKTAADVEKDTDLPRALVKKIVKNKVNQTLASSGSGEPLKDIQINKDALLAFSESAKVFFLEHQLFNCLLDVQSPILDATLLQCVSCTAFSILSNVLF